MNGYFGPPEQKNNFKTLSRVPPNQLNALKSFFFWWRGGGRGARARNLLFAVLCRISIAGESFVNGALPRAFRFACDRGLNGFCCSSSMITPQKRQNGTRSRAETGRGARIGAEQPLSTDIFFLPPRKSEYGFRRRGAGRTVRSPKNRTVFHYGFSRISFVKVESTSEKTETFDTS